jgi:hypothetical protein
LAGKKYIDLALFLAALSDNRVEECGPEKTGGSVGIFDPHMSRGRRKRLRIVELSYSTYPEQCLQGILGYSTGTFPEGVPRKCEQSTTSSCKLLPEEIP